MLKFESLKYCFQICATHHRNNFVFSFFNENFKSTILILDVRCSVLKNNLWKRITFLNVECHYLLDKEMISSSHGARQLRAEWSIILANLIQHRLSNNSKETQESCQIPPEQLETIVFPCLLQETGSGLSRDQQYQCQLAACVPSRCHLNILLYQRSPNTLPYENRPCRSRGGEFPAAF